MKYLCLFLLLVTLSAAGQTNPPPFCCRQPYRILGIGRPVDVSPLIQWWTNQTRVAALPLNAARPVRPLSAWKRITGFKTGQVDDAWVLHAEIAISSTETTNEWILLKNPPAAEAAQYYQLQYLIPQYEQQIVADKRKQAEYTKAVKKNTELASQINQSYSKAAAAAALADQQAAQLALDQARQQIKTIPSVDGQYQIDVFALELGRNAKGQLIYDPGVVYGTGQ